VEPAAGAVEALAVLLGDARRVLLFTGAGASTESGIPDYRSPGGVWSRYRNVLHKEFLADPEARATFWARGRELYPPMQRARPNEAHALGSRLHVEGRLVAVVTQNVDGLHAAAGLPPELVVELHGNAHRVRCLGCGRECARAEVQGRLEAGERVPPCVGCGGILKPCTVSFGQAVPPEALARARELAARCDVCLVIGSSLAVYPAAYVPHWARAAGARLAIINLEPTRLDGLCEVVVRAPAAEVARGLLLGLVHARQARQG
jgi:NAD-dependent deacetylase